VDWVSDLIESCQPLQLLTGLGISEQKAFPFPGLRLQMAGSISPLRHAKELGGSLCSLLGFQQGLNLVPLQIAQAVHVLRAERHLSFQVLSTKNLKEQPRFTVPGSAAFDLLLFTHQAGQIRLNHDQPMLLWHLEVNSFYGRFELRNPKMRVI